MIDALNHELITWLGYLQRGSVLLQLAILLITVMLEKRSRLTRRLNSALMRSVAHLIAPGALIVLGAAMKGLQWPVASPWASASGSRRSSPTSSAASGCCLRDPYVPERF